jgi:glycerophosphoryl diester phosphodiesterase
VSFSDPVLVVGHRGAAGLLPENTLPSFRRAFACGVGAIELDVYAIEGELLVIHDDTLDRTTDGHGPLAGANLAALRKLDAGGGWPIPFLDEVVSILPPGIGLNVELKGADTAAPLARFITDSPIPDLLVSSFDHAELARFHALSPGTRVAPLFDRWTDDAWSIAARFGAWGVNLSRRIATPERLAHARSLGLKTLVYTVNDLDAARAFITNGATGVFTDFPDRVTVEALRAPHPA